MHGRIVRAARGEKERKIKKKQIISAVSNTISHRLNKPNNWLVGYLAGYPDRWTLTYSYLILVFLFFFVFFI